jgi:hypothetical protein
MVSLWFYKIGSSSKNAYNCMHRDCHKRGTPLLTARDASVQADRLRVGLTRGTDFSAAIISAKAKAFWFSPAF